MSLVSNVQVDFSFCDERGRLVQLVHEGFEQVNVLCSHKGVFRGGHYHKVSTERFYVVNGMVELTAARDDQEETVVFKMGECFQIEPYTVHSMRFLEETTLVAMYDISVEKKDGTKDIFPI